MTEIRALTLHQPYASLIARGLKTFETRSWTTSYRGILAIHAGKYDAGTGDELPRGAIVAVGKLTDILSTNDLPTWGLELSASELSYGDFSPDRFAWNVTDVVELMEPIPCNGKQGLWSPSEDVAERLRMAPAA